jgi:hypothetical protein
MKIPSGLDYLLSSSHTTNSGYLRTRISVNLLVVKNQETILPLKANPGNPSG